MPFARRIVPEHFLAVDWDDAWALGWFRMRQTLFTTHFLEFDREVYSAVWLRVDLGAEVLDRTFRELEKRNRRFRLTIAPLDVKGPSDAHEELYQRYRQWVPFEPAPTLKDLLYGDSFHNHFPSWVVSLFDGERLVAGGVFDLGAAAAAGINVFYDPEYRRFSLGKYLIYKKMQFCRDRGLSWFYPGYVAPGQPRFDYKWSLGNPGIQTLDLATGDWMSWRQGDPVPDPFREMESRLKALGPFWRGRTFSPQVRRYLHLDINLNPQVAGMDLFDFPVFLDCFPANVPHLVVVFDLRDDEYHLLLCRSVYHFDRSENDPTVLDSDLLSVDRLLFSSEDPSEVAAVVAGFVAVVQ